MPKSQINSKNDEVDEGMAKMPLTEPSQLKSTYGRTQQNAIEMTNEGDRIPGMTKENSGWDVYNNEARKVDTELVKDWTTSLNFLLIFAAIFAAVLTALIVESKKMLEPDQMSTMVDVMIFYTNNVANGTRVPYSRTDFEPGTSAVVVNCLFFGSLSASLLAALASVIALQWVADYDAAITRGGSSPEDRAKRRQFRYAGVVTWKMSEIIAALPLLLYFSVILFFAGLVLWMWDTNRAVGAVVAVGTGLAVLFYIVSTVIAVAFVSAPFRTPLSRWIYSLLHLPFSLLYWLLSSIRVSTIPSWVKARHLAYRASHKREDQAVENGETLARDSLFWLANQLSLSQDSYRRLLLLVGELPGLKVGHLPSFDANKTLWYRIFDLLGWGYLRMARSADVSTEERRRAMEILQRCYQLPIVRALVDPAKETIPFLTSFYHYWSRYRSMVGDGPWRIPQDGPNRLFLLLRDLPCPVGFSAGEMELTERIYQWRDQQVKDPRVWDEVLSNARSLPSDFFSSCVTVLGNYLSSEIWLILGEHKWEIDKSLARNAVQTAVLVDGLLPLATKSLMRAFEALVTKKIAHRPGENSSWLAWPLLYGKYLHHAPADDHRTHEYLTLLLSRQIKATSGVTTTLQVNNVIKMLWIRPSNPVLRDWDDLVKEGEEEIEVDVNMTSDWIQNADSIPHILEILRNLADAQQRYPTLGPLWRSTGPNDLRDPHFVEALQVFDRLMGMDCTDDDHHMLVNLVCRDLEVEPHPNLDGYFTSSRLDSLARLKDPCLKILVGCARGPEFLSKFYLTKEARKPSLTRLAEFVYQRFLNIDSPTALPLLASLWPMNNNRGKLWEMVMHHADVLDLLRRIFRYPVPCQRCLDGPGHLVSHLLGAGIVKVTNRTILFGKIALEGHYMELTLAVISQLSGNETPSLAGYLTRVDKQVLRELEEELNEILQSQFYLLVMIFNAANELHSSERVGVILVGIQRALQLPPDWRSTILLAPLSMQIRRLADQTSAQANELFAHREVIKEQASITCHLLLTNLAVRSIFGRHNRDRVSCVRAVGDIQPALGWLPPYGG